MKKILIVWLYIFIISICDALAQPGDPTDGNPGQVPIGGIELLLLAGGALGAKRLLKKK